MIEPGAISGIEDPAGQETLELFADTDLFNNWLFENLAPFCKDNILEIGSGIGNISDLLIKRFTEVYLSDLRPGYCEMLRVRFAGNNQLKEVYQLDLGEKAIEKNYSLLVNKFDTVIASNVVEHIDNDHIAVQNCRTLLKTRGRLVVLVPAYNWLYNSFDKELGHYRRYNKTTLKKLLEQEGFEVLHTRYFNAVGILGWWFSGSVLRKKILPKNQLTLYNKLIPFIRLADKLLMKQAGLSVIAVGEKK